MSRGLGARYAEAEERIKVIMGFKESTPELLTDNPFKLIGKNWLLTTAGTPGSFNTKTASWGGLGVLWERKTAFCFIRPRR